MIRRLTTLLTALVLTAIAALAGAPAWEEVTSPPPGVVQSLDTDSSTEILVRDGYIYIWSQRPVTVKLFSILGQQIHQETVPAGLHRLRLGSRGIFILRAGSLTRRITL